MKGRTEDTMGKVTLAVLNEKMEYLIGEVKEIKLAQKEMLEDKKKSDDKFHLLEVDVQKLNTQYDNCPARTTHTKQIDNNRLLLIQVVSWVIMIGIFIIGKAWKP